MRNGKVYNGEMISIITVTHRPTGKYFIGLSLNTVRYLKIFKTAVKTRTLKTKSFLEVINDPDELDFVIDVFETPEEAQEEFDKRTLKNFGDPLSCNLRDPRFRDKPGFYFITHKETGSFYIGSSSSILKRMIKHRTCLKNGNHPNKRMQAIDSNFDNYDIEHRYTENREEAAQIEQEALDDLIDSEECLNVCHNAKGSCSFVHLIKLGDKPPLMIEGRQFVRIIDAARELGIDKSTVRYRLLSEKPKWNNWKYL